MCSAQGTSIFLEMQPLGRTSHHQQESGQWRPRAGAPDSSAGQTSTPPICRLHPGSQQTSPIRTQPPPHPPPPKAMVKHFSSATVADRAAPPTRTSLCGSLSPLVGGVNSMNPWVHLANLNFTSIFTKEVPCNKLCKFNLPGFVPP